MLKKDIYGKRSITVLRKMDFIKQDFHEMHAVIRGRVQGVGFRATTREYALNLGIKGTVCNLANGDVEIYAQGTKSNLEELIRRLEKGVFSGYIEKASVDYYPIQRTYPDFRVIH